MRLEINKRISGEKAKRSKNNIIKNDFVESKIALDNQEVSLNN